MILERSTLSFRRMPIILIVLVAMILMLDSTPRTQTGSLPALDAPTLVIRKSKRTLELRDGDNLVRSYKIVFGFDPKGHKKVEGDGRTPEGDFYVFTKNPESKFHLSLGISYPGI